MQPQLNPTTNIITSKKKSFNDKIIEYALSLRILQEAATISCTETLLVSEDKQEDSTPLLSPIVPNNINNISSINLNNNNNNNLNNNNNPLSVSCSESQQVLEETDNIVSNNIYIKENNNTENNENDTSNIMSLSITELIKTNLNSTIDNNNNNNNSNNISISINSNNSSLIEQYQVPVSSTTTDNNNNINNNNNLNNNNNNTTLQILRLRTTPEFIPPSNFSMITPTIFRSSFITKKNHRFLKYALHLKSICYLCPEDYPETNITFCTKNKIKLFRFEIEGNKEPFLEIQKEKMDEILNCIININNQPILIHCNAGKHRTGCVAGCIRKLQGWGHGSISREYLHFAGDKGRVADQLFVGLYCPVLAVAEGDMSPWVADRYRYKEGNTQGV